MRPLASEGLTSLAPLAHVAPEGPRPGASPEQAGEQFEAYLVGFLAAEMRKTVKDGPFSQGAAAMFADLFDQELGRRIAAGPGIGLKGDLSASIARGLEKVAEPVREAAGHVTSAFGVRADPFTGEARAHHGVDVGLPHGAPIRAARDGVVRFAGDRGGYGNVVIVDHGEGLETRYAHCDTLAVKSGDAVRAGETIATVGSTGRSTGPHLHFELREDGVPIDPEGWLP